MNKKAQTSMEFLLIVGFSLLMIVPATALFINYQSDVKASVINSQVFQVGKEITLTSELIYAVGQGSWQSVDLIVPDAVDNITIYEGDPLSGPSELVVNFGDSTVVLFTDIPLVNSSATGIGDCAAGCLLPIVKGTNTIRVESRSYGGPYPLLRLSVIV